MRDDAGRQRPLVSRLRGQAHGHPGASADGPAHAGARSPRRAIGPALRLLGATLRLLWAAGLTSMRYGGAALRFVADSVLDRVRRGQPIEALVVAFAWAVFVVGVVSLIRILVNVVVALLLSVATVAALLAAIAGVALVLWLLVQYVWRRRRSGRSHR
jgi:hypothetical protein